MGGFCHTEGDTGCVWDLLRLKDVFQVSDQLVIASFSAEREEAAACQSEE